jgi:hypothetical protein
MLVLIAALLFSLTTTGMWMLAVSRDGYLQAIDAAERVQAGYIAEAGLSLAMRRLPSLGPLQNLTLPYTILPDTLFGSGSFRAVLLNDPGDAGGSRDSDGRLILQVIGWSKGQAKRRRIECYLRQDGQPLEVPGALSLSSGITGKLSGTTSVSGADAVTPSVAVAGIAYETPGQSVSMSGSGSVTGIPDYSWASSTYTTGAGFTSSAQEMLASLAASPGSIHATGKFPTTIGTPSTPQVTVIDPGARLKASKAVSGTGVLVIRGQLDCSHGLDFNGLVLVEGTDGLLQVTRGTITGALVVTSPASSTTSARTAFTLNSIAVRYSATAIGYAQDPTSSIRMSSFVMKN